MGEVYHNSFLTISAMDSPNSHVGFLLPRNIQPSIRLHTHKNVYIRRPVRDWSLALRDAPLNKRAWALQERLLSVRVLHYFKEEIFWECLTCSTRESTAETILTSTKPPTPTLLRDTGDLKQLQFSTAPSPVFRLPALAFWYRTIGEYSGRALTNPTDKLPGILGIASTLGSKLGYTYVCGIWKEDYRNGLLWYSLYSHPALDHGHFDINMGWNSRGIRSPLKKSERAKIKRAPSWSWASMESPVTYTPVEGFLEYPLPSAMAPQLLDITETSITLRAWTRRYQCSLNHRKASDEIYWCSESIHRATHDIDEVKSGVTAYDSESNWDGQERWVVLIHERKKVNKNKYLNPNTGRREEVEMKTFLMIIIIPADNSRWRRVGVLSFKYPILMALRDFERMDITLV
ncbi:hypothetical protein DL95DRAFT_370503 [Leptodontidium sp. 2 PMI_412]|nr:hypothetical protein DL95DRAFT_370503 [Leptodontidium sp. 2 PMI_412]